MTRGVNSKIWMTKYRSKKAFLKIRRNYINNPFQITFYTRLPFLRVLKVRLLLASIYAIMRA